MKTLKLVLLTSALFTFNAFACDGVAESVIERVYENSNRRVTIHSVSPYGKQHRGRQVKITGLIYDNYYAVSSRAAYIYQVNLEEQGGYGIDIFELDPQSCQVSFSQNVYAE